MHKMHYTDRSIVEMTGEYEQPMRYQVIVLCIMIIELSSVHTHKYTQLKKYSD